MDLAKTRDQRPCDNCRRRKIRCLFASSDAINCVLCESRLTNCTYVEDPPRKRKSSAPHARLGDEAPRPKPRHSQDAVHIIHDYSLYEGKTLLKQTLGHQNRQSSSVIGPTSDFDPVIIQQLPFDEQGVCLATHRNGSLRRPNATAHFMLRPDTEAEMDQEIADLDSIEDMIAPHGPELVSLYFRIVHPSIPILHKEVFLEKHGRSYRESTPCGLGAVYLMALNWWSFSPSLSHQPKADASKLESAVLKMLFSVHKRPKISDLQGGLVLCQHAEVNSWALTSHLVAMSQNLGINHDCSDWQVPDWEKGVRRRVAWALYMQDKWGALVYGRPSNIRADDWDVQPLSEPDFPETSEHDDDEEGSAEIETGKQIFLHMVSLTMILADILDKFFTLKALRHVTSLQDTLESAKSLQLRLKQWFTDLPPSLAVVDGKSRKLSSIGYLHLAYYTAEATLHRAILRSHTIDSPSTDLILITRQAATERLTNALAFVKRLKQEHLQSFWYFSSKVSLAIIGIFASVLVATSLDSEEQKLHIATLADYRWVVRINSSAAEFMKYAVKILDSSSQLLQQHIERTELMSKAHSEGSGNGNGAIDYAAAAIRMENQSLLPSYDYWDDSSGFDIWPYATRI